MGQAICDDAVDLFGHPAVEAAQASLDVRDPNTKLRGDEGRGDRRVDVTIYDDPVRSFFEQHGLDSLHDPCGLNCVRIGADLEIQVRRWDSQIAKKVAGQHIMVVLAGMHDDLRKAGLNARSMDGRKFRQVRPRAYSVEKLHSSPDRQSSSREYGSVPNVEVSAVYTRLQAAYLELTSSEIRDVKCK